MTLVKISAAALAAAMMTAAIVPAAHAMEETLVEARAARPVAQVKYGDLNLANAGDVQELHTRVRRAATSICMERGNQDLRRQMIGVSCRDTAISSAAPQITAAISNAGTQMAANSAPAIMIAMP